MPAYTVLDTLPEVERQAVLAKLLFVQENLRDRKNIPVLKNFTIKMADICHCTSANISQVISGRNKNPQIIEEMYDYLCSLLGKTNSIINTHATTRALIAGNKFSELEHFAFRAVEADADVETELLKLQNAAKAIVRGLANRQELWAEVDRRIPTNDDDYIGPIAVLTGNGMQQGRLFVPEEMAMMLEYITNLNVRKTDYFDFWAMSAGMTREEAIAMDKASRAVSNN